MTDYREEARKALEAATPGPWTTGDPNAPEWVCSKNWYIACMVSENEPLSAVRSPTATKEAIRANRHLIINAPTWLKLLEADLQAAHIEAEEAQVAETKAGQRVRELEGIIETAEDVAKLRAALKEGG